MKVIGEHECIPYGLSKRLNTRDHQLAIYFCVPIWHVYRTHVYNINSDNFVDGKHTLRLLFRVGRGFGNVFDFRIAWAWVL